MRSDLSTLGGILNTIQQAPSSHVLKSTSKCLDALQSLFRDPLPPTKRLAQQDSFLSACDLVLATSADAVDEDSLYRALTFLAMAIPHVESSCVVDSGEQEEESCIENVVRHVVGLGTARDKSVRQRVCQFVAAFLEGMGPDAEVSLSHFFVSLVSCPCSVRCVCVCAYMCVCVCVIELC